MSENSWYNKYRPKTFKEVLGQPGECKSLINLVRKGLPHAILLSGPSGVGKTTLAKILAHKVGCSNYDIQEINSANFRGIDTVRDIESRMGLAPGFGGKARVWILDEVHKGTNDFQNAFLKPLEFPPRHAFFFLCTTDPNKLIHTLVNRCTHIKLKPLSDLAMQELLQAVAKKEGVKLSDKVLEKLLEVSNGSARKGINYLQQIADLDSTKEQLNELVPEDAEKEAYDLVRMLLYKNPKWPEVAKFVDSVKEDAENFRRLVLGCAAKELLKNGRAGAKAYHLITAFEEPTFFYSGKAGLVRACYQIVVGEE